MEQITPDNVRQIVAKIAVFLRKRVNVTNGGVYYGPVLITPVLETVPVKIHRKKTLELPVLTLRETGESGAGAVVIFPSDSPDGKTFYTLRATSLTFTQITPREGSHEILLQRP